MPRSGGEGGELPIMDIGSLLLAFALILLVAAFVARPVIERAAYRDGNGAASPADDLITQREAILIELRDLDFDHAVGKVGEEDYAVQRARLVARGAEVLRSLDQLPAAAVEKPSDDLDAEIERLVTARRKRQTAAGVKKQPAPSAHCPHCGRPVRLTDKFCTHCGAKVVVAQAAK